MGPRPFGRGRSGTAACSGAGTSGFNGAATFRSRKVADSRLTPISHMLQWGRDLSVAEGRAGAAPAPQGAGASMGPRPFGRGRDAGNLPALPATGLQWGRDLSVAEGSGCRPTRSPTIWLQWGRDLSVAEGCGGAAVPPRASQASMGPRPFGRGRLWPTMRGSVVRPASMGPRPFGRGRAGLGRRHPRTAASFNGAATFRSRKGDNGNVVGRRQSASMGPRPFGRGRFIVQIIPYFSPMLQWGRDLSVAEGAQFCLLYVDVHNASMGPRPFGRGRAIIWAVVENWEVLQWGRDLSVAEGPNRFLHGGRHVLLQWGRDLSVAEGSTCLVQIGF